MNQTERRQAAVSAGRGNLNDLTRLLAEVAQPTVPVPVPNVTVATLPAAADYTGCILFCSNGVAGSPGLVVSDGTNWKIADGSANAAAS